MHRTTLTEQVAQEFREAQHYRGIPVPDERPKVDTEQDVGSIFRNAIRRARGVRIVGR